MSVELLTRPDQKNTFFESKVKEDREETATEPLPQDGSATKARELITGKVSLPRLKRTRSIIGDEGKNFTGEVSYLNNTVYASRHEDYSGRSVRESIVVRTARGWASVDTYATQPDGGSVCVFDGAKKYCGEEAVKALPHVLATIV